MKQLFTAALLLAVLTGCAWKDSGAEQIPSPPTESERTEPAPTESAWLETEVTAVSTEPAPAETEAPTVPAEPPEDADFVRVLDWIPEMEQDLKYAGTDNFTGERIYPFWDGYLRYGTVKKLQRASDMLAEQGYRFKLWDGYRPVSAQWKLWQVCPDSRYVANPEQGYSSHSRGNTVDITLVDQEGRELDMPTGFDDFTARADRNYSDCSDSQADNARLLEQTMEACGFSGYFGEWWHFADTDAYPVERSFEPPLG